RLASEDDRREARAAQNFVHEGELHLPVSLAPQLRAEMTRPEFVFFDFSLKRPYQRVALGIAYVIRMAEDIVERLDLLAHELLDPIELLLEFRFGFKIPAHIVSPSQNSVFLAAPVHTFSANAFRPSLSTFAGLLPFCWRRQERTIPE